MATKRDKPTVTSPDNGATKYYSNPDLAARLKAYQNRTGEYKNKKGGAKFTQPVEGKPTSNRARGGQQPAPPRPQQPQQPQGTRPSMFTAPVQGPLPQAQQGFTRPQNAITQAPPAGSFGPQMPQLQPMNPQGPVAGYQPPQQMQRGAPPQPQYNPLPQGMQQQQQPPPGYQPPPMQQQGGYMPPRPMATMGDMGGLNPLSTNPWGRQW
jgi:hypothetical protein